MDKNRKTQILLSVSISLVIITCAYVFLVYQHDDDTYEYILNLNWSDYIPLNFSGFQEISFYKGIVFEYRDNWRYIIVDLKHEKYPWEDMTVTLRYNLNTEEQVIGIIG